jgi:hypothetical protein
MEEVECLVRYLGNKYGVRLSIKSTKDGVPDKSRFQLKQLTVDSGIYEGEFQLYIVAHVLGHISQLADGNKWNTEIVSKVESTTPPGNFTRHEMETYKAFEMHAFSIGYSILEDALGADRINNSRYSAFAAADFSRYWFYLCSNERDTNEHFNTRFEKALIAIQRRELPAITRCAVPQSLEGALELAVV